MFNPILPTKIHTEGIFRPNKRISTKDDMHNVFSTRTIVHQWFLLGLSPPNLHISTQTNLNIFK